MQIEKSSFGITKAGTEVFLYRIKNSNGMEIAVTDFGASLVQVLAPDRNGELADVVLGYDHVTGYEIHKGHLGAAVGRNSNRIEKASFLLNGREIMLSANDHANNLHSGPDFYDQRVWNTEVLEEENAVRFSLHSPDGDQGFPGNADVSLTYRLTGDNGVILEYDGVADQDTVFNMTNHSYFNLAGHNSGTILEQVVWLDADYFTEADAESIPHGVLTPVEGTPMDFRKPKKVGRDVEADYEALHFGCGYDHNWALNGAGAFRLVGSFLDPASGRLMEIFTDTPGIQMYGGNFLNAVGKGSAAYTKNCGICFETQYFPNCLNIEHFEKPVFQAGQKYHSVTEYRFGVKGVEDEA